MNVIQGVITDYQTVTHVTGRIVGESGGSISSSHIATFQVDGQPVQLRGIAPAGLVNGDVIRVTGQRNNSGIFEARYYFNSTRKCHSPPPSLGFSKFAANVFVFAGIAIFLGCLAIDWIIYSENIDTDLWGLVSSNIPAGLLAALLFELGRRWNSDIRIAQRGYRDFINGAA